MKGCKNAKRAAIRAAAWLALLPILGCGGPKGTVRRIPPEVQARLDRGVDSYGESGRALFEHENDRFSSLVTRFRGGLHREVRGRFHHDPRLDSVALLVTNAYAGRDSRVAPGLMEWTVNRMGILGNVVMTPTAYWDGTTGMMNLDKVISGYAKEIRPSQWTSERYAFGVARLRLPPQRFAVGLVIVEQPAIIDEIPKRFEPGQVIALGGRVRKQSEIVVARLSASEQESYGFMLPIDDAGRFAFDIPAPTEPGRHRLQVISWDREGGANLAVNIPIYVGRDEPHRPDETTLSPPPNPVPGALWDQRILRAMNDSRRRFGLPPLVRSPGLDAVLQRRVEARVANPHRRRPILREDLHRAGLEWASWSSTQRRYEFLAEMLGELSDDGSDALDPFHAEVGIATAAEPVKGKGARMYRSEIITYRSEPSEGRSLAERTIAALRQKVERYDDHLGSAAKDGPRTGSAFAAALEAALAGPAGGRMRYEPSLDVLAAEYLAGGTLPGVVDDFILRRLGFTGSLDWVKTRLVRRDDPGPHLPLELAAAAGHNEAARSREYMFGVAREPRGQGVSLETVLVVSRQVAFEPFPRRLEPGEELTVEGRFVHGAGKDGGCKLQNPALWLGGPDRRSTRVALALDADCGFVTRVVVPREPGAYLMEITHAPAIARDRRVELHFHTAAQAEIVVGGDEALEPDPGWMRPVDEPPGAGERLAIVRREIERVRAEAGLTGLAENRLATFLLEDQLLRAYHQRRVPTFQDIAAILETHGEGDTSLGFGGALYRVVERLAIRFNDPSVRKVLLDPATESFGLATDPDGDVFRIVFLGRGEDEGDRGAGADARLGSAPLPVPPRARTGILAPSVVSGIFENQRQRLVKCFRDEAAWVERGYAVEARFEVVVGSTGKVVAARAEGARADPRGFEACVLGVLGKMSFPVPTPSARGPAVVFVSRSLRFTSRGEDKIQLTIGQ